APVYRAWTDFFLIWPSFSRRWDIRGRSFESSAEVPFAIFSGFALWWLALGPAFLTHIAPMLAAYCWIVVIAFIVLSAVTTVIWRTTGFGKLLERLGTKDPSTEAKSGEDGTTSARGPLLEAGTPGASKDVSEAPRKSGNSAQGEARAPLSNAELFKYVVIRIIICMLWEVFVVWATQAFFFYAIRLYQDRTLYLTSIYDEYNLRATSRYFDDVRRILRQVMDHINATKLIDFISVLFHVFP
ncbi:hypothetical protein HK102_011155, partial [Quaeritorhiza haematococci]